MWIIQKQCWDHNHEHIKPTFPLVMKNKNSRECLESPLRKHKLKEKDIRKAKVKYKVSINF